MAKKTLTDRLLKSLKPAAPGRRYDVADTEVAGFMVRVTDRGVKSFMLSARLPGAKWSTRRLIGVYDETTLEVAREKARDWRRAIRDDRNPIAEEDAAKRARRRQAANTFSSVAEAFIAHAKLHGQRKAGELEQDLRREFIARWADRPVTDIASADVREVIEAKLAEGKEKLAKDRRAKGLPPPTDEQPYRAQAHNLFGTIRRLFSWAEGQDAYGLGRSPCDKLRPKDLIGQRAVRERTLNDKELVAFWRSAGALGYPYGPLLQLLLVTGQRKSDIAEAVRSELDLASRRIPLLREGKAEQRGEGKVEQRELGLTLTIPKERMKMKRPHVVPLSTMAVALFKSLPQFKEGPHLFSTTFGVQPVNGFAKAKTRIDALMLSELRAMAKEHGEDTDQAELEPWVFHDLRRTARSGLSQLRVPPLWSEHVIAHAKKGLARHYDQHEYLDEKREALDLWASHLRSIIDPTPQTPSLLPVGLVPRACR